MHPITRAILSDWPDPQAAPCSRSLVFHPDSLFISNFIFMHRGSLRTVGTLFGQAKIELSPSDQLLTTIDRSHNPCFGSD
jgi:hypothetical protein